MKWEVMSDKWWVRSDEVRSDEVRSEKLTAVFVNRNGNVVILQQKRQEWRARRSQATRTERKGPPHGADEARARSNASLVMSEKWWVRSEKWWVKRGHPMWGAPLCSVWTNKEKRVFLWFFAHLFVPFRTARRYFRSTIKTKMCFFVLYCAHLFVPLQPKLHIIHIWKRKF